MRFQGVGALRGVGGAEPCALGAGGAGVAAPGPGMPEAVAAGPVDTDAAVLLLATGRRPIRSVTAIAASTTSAMIPHTVMTAYGHLFQLVRSDEGVRRQPSLLQ